MAAKSVDLIQRWCFFAPMLEWNDYKLLLALARAKTIRGAAALLAVNHGTVSRRLTYLAGVLQDDLFERTPQGYRPTVLGETLVDSALKMELASMEAERRSKALAQDLRGPVKISIPEVFGRYLLLNDLADLRNEFPEIELTIEVSYALANLDRSEADIAVRGTQAPPDHLVGRRLCQINVAHYCAVGYLEQTPEEDRNWIVRARDQSVRDWIARSPFPHVPIGMVVNDIGLRHALAAEGLGLALGACFICDQIPNMMRLPGSSPFKIEDLWVLTHPDLKKVPRISQIMSFLYDRLSRKFDLLEGVLSS